MEDSTVSVLKFENKNPIEKLYAVFSVDEKGNEGIMGYVGDSGLSTPLVTANPKLLSKMEIIGKEIGKASGMSVKVKTFTLIEERSI